MVLFTFGVKPGFKTGKLVYGKALRIVHVITGLDTGGAESMLLKLIEHGGGGDTPVVVSLMTGGAIAQQIENLGIPVYSLGMKRGRMGILPLYSLARILRQTKPDAVQGWMYHGNLAATLALSLVDRAIPLFWNIRQSLYDIGTERRLTRLTIRISAKLSSRPQAIIYNSQVSQHQHEAIGFDRKKSRWIANGFDCEKFRPDENARVGLRAELGLESDVFLIGMVARFHPMKDHATFLLAASLLSRKFPRVCFVLVGMGMTESNAALAALCASLPNPICLRLLNEREDLPFITAALDVATLSSWSEAFPNVLGEAMACAVPCVATDVGESATIIGETGLIVPPRNPEKLAKAWESMLLMPQEDRVNLGRQARQRIVENYSIEKVSTTYANIYKSCSGENVKAMPSTEISSCNRDELVVQGFGDEWSRFSQEVLSDEERKAIFEDYFGIFPWKSLPSDAVGADIGCGSGRWAAIVAPRVGRLVCLDASINALRVARENLRGLLNVKFHQADVGNLPFAAGQLDFAYSLGVLHHVPDTPRAIANVAKVLKPGGLFLLYLYYAFDNKPRWFRVIWRVTDMMRHVISRLPKFLRFVVCDVIAVMIYWPLAKIARGLEKVGLNPESFPLWYYRDKSFYVMRTDALDRFGTRLEKRFTKIQIQVMLETAGFEQVRFSQKQPYWCAVGVKKN